MHTFRHSVMFKLLVAGCALAPITALAQGKITTPAQQKLGHFKTADGMYGFTLDRSGATAKLQIDGDKAIYELTMEEDRKHGTLEGYKFYSPDGKLRLYISSGGSIKYFRNADAHWVTFDKDVKALPAATVKGKPVKEVPAYEKLSKELDAISVRKKFPAMTANDASNLAKVTEAFNNAPAAMYMRYKAPADGWGANYVIAPVDGAGYGRNEYVTDEAETKRHKKLAKYGAIIRGFSNPDMPQAGHVIVDRAENNKVALADGMPGLVWEVVDTTTAVFVSLDGARYTMSLTGATPLLEKGAGPDTAWPKKVADPYLDYSMISSLAKAGAVPKATVEGLEKIDLEWTQCTAKGWPKVIAKYDTGKMSVAQMKTAINNMHKACNKALDKYETAIVKVIEERLKARTDLLTAATAKAKAAK